MPQTRDRQVLHWDEVYLQFADAAEAMPIEAVDRELVAMGYDLDKVRDAVGRLDRHAGERTAGLLAVSRAAHERLPVVPPTALRAIQHGRGAPERYRAERWWAAAAGAAGAVLVVLLVLPISGAVVVRWSEPHVQLAEAKSGSTAEPRGTYTGSPDEAEERYRAKVAILKKCAAYRGLCDGKLTSAGEKESPPPKHNDSSGKSVVASAKGSGLPDTSKHS